MAGDSNNMQILWFLFAFIAVLALIGLAAWLVRRFAGNRLGANTNRGRMPRLAVIDAAAVDGRRRLVLVRRDNVEHLLMIGGPTDIVIEPNIVRAIAARDQAPTRPVASAEPPPRVAPLPDTAWAEAESARTEIFETPEPAMPEPRPARPSFAEELRRPAGAPLPERRDPLAGFTPEPLGNRLERTEPRPEPIPPRVPRPERSEPLIPRPPRAAEPKVAPLRTPERAAAPPPAPPPPPPPSPPSPPPDTSSADANLAEMAQRLEAALRRPASEAAAPPVAPEPAPTPRPAPPPGPAPQKSGFENLEDEMASLLGRPKNPS
ncbi:flagellar biosynthetic protein FliO [Bradyrhizobium sp. Ai1a-2]|uniref:flagellar biosynthetic protein FliO n=1 Tax=Bradyrhizobium sp. Ai1a-2 TaxID=196490 RepID=UPI001FCAC763|nr:flagellar biosynthetic protein FliO [Bradyrhizobium sp. Ai1a-2]